MVENKVKEYNSIHEMKINLFTWYNSILVGNNLSYNIWDEVVCDYLIKKLNNKKIF